MRRSPDARSAAALDRGSASAAKSLASGSSFLGLLAGIPSPARKRERGEIRMAEQRKSKSLCRSASQVSADNFCAGTLDAFRAASALLLNYTKAFTTPTPSSSKEQTLATTAHATATDQDVRSDLGTLLPAIRHDITALSLLFTISDDSPPPILEPAAPAGAAKILDGLVGKTEKVVLATEMWMKRREAWGECKAKELRWATVEILESTSRLLLLLAELFSCLRSNSASKPFNLTPDIKAKRETVLQATAAAWAAVDAMIGKAAGGEREALRDAWREQRSTIEDALSEALELLEEDRPADDDDDEEGEDLSSAEKERVEAAVPILKLVKLLLTRLSSSVALGPSSSPASLSSGSGLGTLLAVLSIKELDDLAQQTSSATDTVDDLVIALSGVGGSAEAGGQDLEDIKASVQALKAWARTLVAAIAPPNVAEVEKALGGLSIQPDSASLEAERVRQRKEREWIDMWALQVDKASDKLLAL